MKTVSSENHRPDEHSPEKDFQYAINRLVSVIGAKSTLNEKATEDSLSAALFSASLQHAKQGYVKVINCNNEKFVIFSADQIVELANGLEPKAKQTMGELYPNLPFLPDSEDRPRYSPLADTIDHLRDRVKN
jgi:hypothetical protein